jgi:acyl-CoA thioesterase FadM
MMKKVSIGETFICTFRILPQECGTKVMFNATAPGLFELARLDMMVRSGIFPIVIKEKLYTPLATIAVTYHRPILRFQKVEIHSKITGFDEKWFYFRHDIYTGKKVYISAVGSGVFKKGRETLEPKEMLRRLGATSFPHLTEKDRELTRQLDRPDL